MPRCSVGGNANGQRISQLHYVEAITSTCRVANKLHAAARKWLQSISSCPNMIVVIYLCLRTAFLKKLLIGFRGS